MNIERHWNNGSRSIFLTFYFLILMYNYLKGLNQNMTEEEIKEQFKKLDILIEKDADYSDPYSFALKLREDLPKDEYNICYSNSTILPQYTSYNA
ncbi:MAG: hypothetical protein PHY73_05520 [Candidatus Omnitrophica bacterium]|nr:hypothetical protein [Candidatus Omnitrophota bacterium]